MPTSSLRSRFAVHLAVSLLVCPTLSAVTEAAEPLPLQPIAEVGIALDPPMPVPNGAGLAVSADGRLVGLQRGTAYTMYVAPEFVLPPTTEGVADATRPASTHPARSLRQVFATEPLATVVRKATISPDNSALVLIAQATDVGSIIRLLGTGTEPQKKAAHDLLLSSPPTVFALGVVRRPSELEPWHDLLRLELCRAHQCSSIEELALRIPRRPDARYYSLPALGPDGRTKYGQPLGIRDDERLDDRFEPLSVDFIAPGLLLIGQAYVGAVMNVSQKPMKYPDAFVKVLAGTGRGGRVVLSHAPAAGLAVNWGLNDLTLIDIQSGETRLKFSRPSPPAIVKSPDGLSTKKVYSRVADETVSPDATTFFESRVATMVANIKPSDAPSDSDPNVQPVEVRLIIRALALAKPERPDSGPKVLWQVALPPDVEGRSLTVSPNGKYLAVLLARAEEATPASDITPAVQVLDAATGKLVATLNTEFPVQVAFDPRNSDRLWVSTERGQALLFDITTGW